MRLNTERSAAVPRTITVRGEGRMELVPDTAVLTVVLSSKNTDYAAAVAGAEKQSDSLRDGLKAAEFDPGDLKTVDMNVNSEYEYLPDGNGEAKRVFTGFAVRQVLEMRFPLENRLINAAFGAVSGCMAEPELSLRFDVADKPSRHDGLLRLAAENAQNSAGVLAKALGARVGKLLSVEYGAATPGSLSDNAFGAKLARAECASFDISPQAVVLSESAVFVWELE